jgi:aspartokinase
VNTLTGVAHNIQLSRIVIKEASYNCKEILEKAGQVNLFSFEANSLSFLFQKARLSELKSVLKDMKYELDDDIGLVTVVGRAFTADSRIFSEIVEILNKTIVQIKQLVITNSAISIVVPLHQTEFIVNALQPLIGSVIE